MCYWPKAACGWLLDMELAVSHLEGRELSQVPQVHIWSWPCLGHVLSLSWLCNTPSVVGSPSGGAALLVSWLPGEQAAASLALLGSCLVSSSLTLLAADAPLWGAKAHL